MALGDYSNPFKVYGPPEPPLMVYFLKCRCHIWAVAAGYRVGRCKECRELGMPCEEPESGMSERL